MATSVTTTDKIKGYVDTGLDSRATYRESHARLWMTTLLVLADISSLVIAGFGAILIRLSLGLFFESVVPLEHLNLYWNFVPVILVFPGVYALRGLYPSVGLNPVEELRRVTTSTSAVFLFITAITFWVRNAELYSRLVFAFAWIFALITIPACRWILRAIAVKIGMWGEPVAIIGYGPQGQRIVQYLLQRQHLGIRPAVIIEDPDISDNFEAPIPKLLHNSSIDIKKKFIKSGIRTAIIVASELTDKMQNLIVDEQAYAFRHLILISDLSWVGSLGVTPYDMEGFLGLEIRQNLLNPWERHLKRVIDFCISLFIGILTLPFLILIAILIRLDSKGSTLFSQERIGESGKSITVWKFRTMLEQGDRVLEDYLSDNSELITEWQTTHKLKNDPRVTRIGKVLRKYSLDELPQIWNVIKGDMSLVGPRPFLPEEKHQYQAGFGLYKRVRPGITGFWQVSGRADLSFQDRVRLDEYYVRNWSIWLDIYILLRTLWVVARRDGAY